MAFGEGTTISPGTASLANRLERRKKVKTKPAPVAVRPDIQDRLDDAKKRKVAEAAVIGHKKLLAKRSQLEGTSTRTPPVKIPPYGKLTPRQQAAATARANERYYAASIAPNGTVGELGLHAGMQAAAIAKGFLPAMLEAGKAIGTDVKNVDPTFAKTREDVIDPMVDQYRWQYGPLFEGDVEEAWKRFKGYEVKDPETGKMVLMGGPLAPVLDATGFGKLASLGKARALGRPTGIPAEARTLPLGSGRSKIDVQVPSSPNPLHRKSQELFDEFSRRYDQTPVVGRLVGSTKRAGRQAARELKRGQTRALAGNARHARAIQKVSFNKLGHGRDDLRTALFWDAHLPDELRGVEGLQMIRDDLERELNSPLPRSNIPEAPGLVKQRKRVETATKMYEDALAKEREKSAPELIHVSERLVPDRRRSLPESAFREEYVESKPTAKKPGRESDLKVGLGSATVQRFGAAASREKDKLRTQELRHARRVARNDLEGLRNLRDELEKQVDRAEPGSAHYDTLDAQLDRIEKAVAEKEQVVAFASRRREKQLRDRLSDLDKAIVAREKVDSNPKAKERYERALVGAARLTEEMEAIKLEAFGPELAVQFSARRGLFGEHLGLDPEDAVSDIYARHTAQLEGAREKVAGKPASGVFGRTDTRGLLGGGENELLLYRYGALKTDPDVVIESYLRAQSFRYLNEVKKLLSDVGEDIPVGGRPNPGWYVVNPNGKVLPSWWKAIEDGDDGVFLDAVKAYGQQILGDADDAASMVNFVDPETGLPMGGVRQVDPRIVHAMFGKHSQPGGKASPIGQVSDVVNQLVKTSLLYLNPGYIPANLAGNLVFLGVQQPAHAIPNLLRSAQTIWRDRELADLIEAEVGHGPTMSVAAELQPGQSRGVRATLNVNRRIANRVSGISDNWPRMAAWLYEARKAGFKSRDDQLRLLRGESPELERQRMEVSSRANEAMVNFDRLGPDEKATLGRVFFVWPWIRGATAYAGRFVLDQPEKAALIAPNAIQESEELEETLGKLRGYLSGVIPTGPVDGTIAEVINGGPISPLSTALEMGETVTGVANALRTDEPTPRYRRVGDMITPILGTALAIVDSEDAFGREVGQREAIVDAGRRLAPVLDLAADLAEPGEGGVYPGDATRAGRLKRAARILPYELDLEKARDDANRLKGPQRSEAEDLALWTKVYGKLPAHVVRARKLQTAYQLSREVLKKQVDVRRLTNKQNTALKLAVWAQMPSVSPADVDEGKSYLAGLKNGSAELRAMDAWLERELGWSTALRWAHEHDGRQQ